MNDLRHLYLYAKGHYQKQDRFGDLKKILSPFTGVSHIHLSDSEVMYWLCKEAYQYMDNLDGFLAFVGNIRPGGVREIICRDDRDIDMKIIDTCLGILKYRDINKIKFDIGQADSNILPLSKGSTRKILFRKYQL